MDSRTTRLLIAAILVVALAAGAVWLALARTAEEPAARVPSGSQPSAVASAAPATPPAGSVAGTASAGASAGGPSAGSSQPQAPATLRPAEPGAPLAQITSPPQESVWAFKPDRYDEGARIELEFRPYGTGPGSLGASVIALVDSARPLSGGEVPELAGRNVVLVVGDTTVVEGGTYRGIGVVTLRGDRSVVVLQSATLSR